MGFGRARPTLRASDTSKPQLLEASLLGTERAREARPRLHARKGWLVRSAGRGVARAGGLRSFSVRTLIVATDGSDLAVHAAVAGVSLARPADRLLVVCAVDLIDPGEDATGHAGPTVTEEQAAAGNREVREQGEAAVAGTAEAMRDLGYAPEQVETRLVEGEPGPALCRVAGEVDASALIVGTRGRGGLTRALLGSTSDYIVRNAPCSVIVSRNTQP